jgi:serine/threonine protein kinase
MTHRDLKPENILLDADLHPYLAGFGFTRKIDPANPSSMIGTPNYMAPEIFTHHYDEKVDVWAFGMTMYSLFSGRIPYDEGRKHGEDTWRGMTKEAIRKGTPVVEFPTDPGLAFFRSLFERCTDRNPANRPSMAQVGQELLIFVEEAKADLDYDRFTAYARSLSEPRKVVHGSIAEVQQAVGRFRVATTAYGIMLYDGIGMAPDPPSGVEWLKKAAAMGCPIARANLLTIEEQTGENFDLGEQPPTPTRMSELASVRCQSGTPRL